MWNGDTGPYVQGGMDDAGRKAGTSPTRGPTRGPDARRGGARQNGVWRRTLEYAGVLVVALGGTAVLYGAAVGDRDILEVLAFLVLAAALFQLLVRWLAGPLRDTRAAVFVARGAAGLFALAIALVLAWPSGDWIPDNDPAATDSFISPSVNLAQAWLYFMPGYAAAVLVLLAALRLRHRRRAASSPASGAPAGTPGRARGLPPGEAADLLVVGLPMAAILLLEGLLPLPGDGAGYTAVVVLAGVWCAASTLAGAAWLTRRAR